MEAGHLTHTDRTTKEVSDSLHTRGVFSRQMIYLVWVPVVLITVFHYLTVPHLHWLHDVLRRLYYIPILLAALQGGVRSGILLGLVSSIIYIPHAFTDWSWYQDPGTSVNKLLEIVLYNSIGFLAGLLVDREAARRRQAEDALASQEKMAHQLIRAGRLAALGELVAGIAHEIKNPLHTLKGTAEIVSEVIPEDSEQANMWRLHRKELDRMERLVSRFLSFGKPAPPCLTWRPCREVFGHVQELLKTQLSQHKGMKLSIIPCDLNRGKAEVEVDPDQLAQVLLNLSSNAIGATEGVGQLTLSAELRSSDSESGQLFVLRLENDGPIIPHDQIERIFDPFFTTRQDGTGLGLAIAVRIAEGHGGYMNVTNTGDTRGVAFELLIPSRPLSHGGQ